MTATVGLTPLPGRVADDLQPVRVALLADATSAAEQISVEAERAADELVAEAERAAEAEVDRVRHRREQSARAAAEQVLDRASNDAHRIVLDTETQIHRQLIDEARTAALALRHDPRYPALLDHLETIAQAQLGPAAIIERDPEHVGGLRASAGNRRVDYTLPALVDRALDALGDEVADLCS